MVVQSQFIAVAHRIVWCTVATVDHRNRPRSRVLHPYWDLHDDELVGWITTRPTPLKVAHLEHTPYVSCSYWDATHDVAVAECHAEWVEDAAVKQHAWDLFRTAPEPLGHDPYAIWPDGPEDPDAGVLRLSPWRLRVAGMEALLGRSAPLVWRAPDAARPPRRRAALR
jgi:general stress protein 26